MIIGPPLSDYFGTFETTKHVFRMAGRVKPLKASCRNWREKPGIAAKPEDWEVGPSNIGQHDRKWFNSTQMKSNWVVTICCIILLCYIML